MTRIDVQPFVRLGRQKRLPFKHYDHHDGCELEHVACAVLFLAGALDNAQSMIEELLADRERLSYGTPITPDMIGATTTADRERFTTGRQDQQFTNAQVEIARLRAQLESAKAWMPAWAWEEMNSPEEDEAWKNL